MIHSRVWARLAAVSQLLVSGWACAQFSAGISPPRFEIGLQPGATERKVVELVNPGDAPAPFKVYTNDWTIQEDGQIRFFDELQEGSCRPWVAIERKSFELPPGAKIRFRFEVTPPPQWDGRECRFMLFFEGEKTASAGAIAANGRLGVVVYVRPRDATLSAQVLESRPIEQDGHRLAALMVRNPGQVTVRVSGMLQGRDVAGKRWYLNVSGVPVLPGQTRAVLLQPVDPMNPSESVPSNWSGELDVQGELRLSETDRTVLPVALKIKAP